MATDDLSASDRAFLSSAIESRVAVTDGRYGRLYELLAEAPPAGPGLPPVVALDGRYYAANLYIR
ncbi:hypothetical protein [Halorarius litoreus]|uniref:hypothetical protein n=1 Tax=Halorarius litoreus TaxID=2962676 RepID=UPI0020CFCAD7|nr:hypothetical protein [Halorarius litoreus]